MRDSFICSGREFRGFALLDHQDHMEVIGHDHVLIHRHMGNVMCGSYILFDSFSNFGKLYLRGVVGAAPYNGSEQFFLVSSANRQKIKAHIGVAVKAQTVWFPLRTVNFHLLQSAVLQDCGVELDQVDPVQAVFGAQNKGFRQIVGGGHHLAVLLGPGQKFPGALFIGAVVQIKNADDGAVPDRHIVADGNILSRPLQ